MDEHEHPTPSPPARALVIGGSGAVGSEVVRLLRASGHDVRFTYHRSLPVADALESETGAVAEPLDLADPAALGSMFQRLEKPPGLVVQCAAPALSTGWDLTQRVIGATAFTLCEKLGPRMADNGGGSLTFTGGLSPGQSLPLPLPYAAAQGLLGSLVMAAAKVLGPRRVRVNLVALGPLDRGLSRGLPPERLDAYRRFSALGRLGTPAEAARAIVWLATRGHYINGRVLPANGGI